MKIRVASGCEATLLYWFCEVCLEYSLSCLADTADRGCHYSQKTEPNIGNIVSITFDKFYFIPGFFTLSLSLAFSIDLLMTFMLLTNH
jgi:hypothetical protein